MKHAPDRLDAPPRVEANRALSPEQRAFVQYLAEEALRQWRQEQTSDAKRAA